MRAKLLIIFLAVKVIPLILLTVIAWYQFVSLGASVTGIAVNDATEALNHSAIESIERMTTDTASQVANFLYERDGDVAYLAAVASMDPAEDFYRDYINNEVSRVIDRGSWILAEDGQSWVQVDTPEPAENTAVSTNPQNNDNDGFNTRPPETYKYKEIPIYDEITFVDIDGREQMKVVAADSTKTRYPMDPKLKDISKPENTYVKAENYFEKLRDLKAGEIYVSDVIGAYVGSNFVGMYTPDSVKAASAERGYDINYDPEAQAYAGEEDPVGIRFEGIVRWASPVVKNGRIIGYITLAMNHDHLMEFVDHQTPMEERYTQLPSAFEGNYAFIWDYKCRSICHPRHNSIVGYDPETGDPQIPWLEQSIYTGWQESGAPKWYEYIAEAGIPSFDDQSRDKKPAAELTKEGFVGLDGRYLNNAPQCTGWMDLTKDGGSGSFYILWSGIQKLTTAASIPYYTGQYAPSAENDFSKRGFGFVAIGAGLDDFTKPALDTEKRLKESIDDSLADTLRILIITTAILVVIVIFIAIWLASWLTNNITNLIRGIARFRAGERQYRFNAPIKDEFGTLADAFDEMADSIVESVKSPLSIIRTDHTIVYMNEYGLALGDHKLEDVIGNSYDDYSVYPPGSKYDPITALEENRDSEIYYAESRDSYVKGAANYFVGRDGERIGYIVLSTDVTDMVMKQIELEQAVTEANMANEHKGQFLARMSHEIRTPMNAIIGITNIVLNKLGDNTQQAQDLSEIEQHVQQIETSSQHLLGLLNDILDISKIEAGKIDINEESMDLMKLASTVGGIIRPRCDEKHITFNTEFDEFDSSVFISDPVRLRQVLINLLGNAAKFTPELGRIDFIIRNEKQEEGRTLIKFLVKDTGIGISQDKVDEIFKPFEQASGSISVEYGGTGLGLAISRRIVELMGGEIELESSEGKGSEFCFSLWLKNAEDAVVTAAHAEDAIGRFEGRRALVVDDVEINRMIVAGLLEDTGLVIDEAEDGEVAFEMFRDAPAGTYDIIFMDIQMPVMNGYQSAESIRSIDRPDAKTVPIIALTANAFKEDIDHAIQCGMDSHIAKPVETEKLVEVLFRYLK
jgi:signal transduction histidine kinase/HAMP domain-containing protein/ActR/RegA family two-component response regulator